jgi:hypothetical protein
MNKTTYEQPIDGNLPMAEAKMSRSEALATRLEAGASALAAFAKTLSEAEWQTRIPKDGRKIGVVVHHVASVSWDAIHTMNRDHAKGNDSATKSDTLALLAAAIRAPTDDELDRAAPVSLNSDAPLTCQFIIEDHAVRHSYHHLASIRAALARQDAQDE